MAASVSGQDIGLIFGLDGGGSLPGRTGVHIREQLADLVKNLNSDAQVKQRKLKFSLDVAGTKKNFSDGLRQITSGLSEQKQFKIKLAKIDASAAIRDFQSKIQNVLNTLQVKNGMTVSVKDFNSGGKIKGDLGGTKSLAEATQRAREYAVQLGTIKELFSTLNASQRSLVKIDGVDQSKIIELTQRIETLKIRMEEFRDAENQPNRAFVDEFVTEAAAITHVTDALIRDSVASENSAKSAERYNAAVKRVDDELSRVRKNLDGWTKAKTGKSADAYKNLENEAKFLESLSIKLKSREISLDDFDRALSTSRQRLSGWRTEIRNAHEDTKTFVDRIGGLAKKFGEWFSLTRIIMAAYRAIKQMVSSVIELDSAMTQLKIVTGANNSTMTTFLSNATVQAKELGQSITDVLKSIETFSRLGYNLDESSILAKYTGILANVANVSSEEATTGVTSIIKGYQMDVENTEHVADVLIEVGQKYAVSAAELIEAFEKSGAALNATNTSFEKSAGLIAAANASVQNASTVGTALKTVSARIRGSKSDLDELGEDVSDLANGFSKYAKELQALTGFDIMADSKAGTFKDIYDIFDGIAGVWDKLSDTQQARVAEILGGTRQLQVISSILGNWSDAAGAYQSAMDSAGTATEANATYMESIQGKIGQFKATFQELSNTLIGSDFVKQFVELGTQLLKILNGVAKLIDAVGGLNTVLGATIGLVVAMNSAAIATQITKLIAPIKSLVGWFGTVKASGLTAFQVVQNGFAQITTSASAFFGVIGIAITICSVIYAAYQALHKSTKELREEYEAATAEIEELNSELETTKERIAELISLSNSGAITLTDAEELQNLRLENAELERKIRLKKEEQQISAGKTNKSLEKDWNKLKYDNVDRITAVHSDMDAISENAPVGFVRGGDYAYVDTAGLTDEQIDLAGKAVDTYNTLRDELLYYANTIEVVSPEDYIARLIERYKELSDLGTDMSSSQIAELEGLRETLVGLGTTIDEDFLDKYVGDGEMVDAWKELATAIDAALFPAEHFAALLAELPNHVQEAISAKSIDGLTPQEVTELAGTFGELSQLMAGSGYTAADVAKHYNALRESAEELSDTDNPLEHFGASDVVETIAKAETEITKICKVLGEFSEDGVVSAVTLETLRETFGNCEEFQNFVDVMSDANSTMGQAQSASDALAKEWINQLDILSLVNEETAGSVEALLKLTGVTNAHEVVEAQLNSVRAQAWLESNNLSDATAEEVAQKLTDADVTEKLRRAILNHKFATEEAKIATGAYNGTLEDQIGVLASIANTAGIATGSLSALAEAQVLVDRYESGELKNSRYWMNNNSDSQKSRYQERIEALTKKAKEQFSELLNQNISITTSVKTVRSGSSSNNNSSSSDEASKEVEKYEAAIDRLYHKKEMLRRQELEDSRIADRISRTDDSIGGLKERISLTQDLIAGYEEENRQLHELAGVNRGTAGDPRFDYDTARAEILEKINEFEKEYGIQIQYNAETNELLCDRLKEINELTEDRSKTYETEADRQEAQNSRIKEAEELWNEIDQKVRDCREHSAQYEENINNIHEKNQQVIDDLKQIVEVASSIVDEVQSVYTTLQKAADEYAANDGFISVDTFQEITAAGLEYMQYLTDENGLLKLERESILDLIKAKTEYMALEAAESYVSRVIASTKEGAIESTNRLTLAQDNLTASNWAYLESKLAIEHDNGKLTDDQYAGALENLRNYRMILTGVNVEFNEHADKMTKANEAMDKILEYTIELVKQQVQDEIDGLNELIDKYNELVNAKKEALDKTKEEDDYADKVLEKTKKLANLQADADLLRLAANSGDRSAQAKLAKNLEEQEELQKELNETQRDHSIDAQKEALDKMAEDYKDEKDKEIEALQKSISSQQKLYDKAIAYIDEHWDTLYSDLVKWNYEYGSTIEEEITQNWALATDALEDYKAAYADVKTFTDVIRKRNDAKYGTYDTTINEDGTSVVKQTSQTKNDTVAKDVSVRVQEKIREMRDNSDDWRNTGDPKAREHLQNENNRLAEEIEDLLKVELKRGSDGVWYLPDGQRLYDVYGGTFHSGGIVGGGTLKENEQMAVLQKGEPVISNLHKQALFDLVDFASVLTNRLGDINPAGLDIVSSARNERLAKRLMEAEVGGAPSVRFGDVYIYGANDETVRQHKEVNRQFANEVLKYLNIKP